jgi:hypothetical protein
VSTLVRGCVINIARVVGAQIDGMGRVTADSLRPRRNACKMPSLFHDENADRRGQPDRVGYRGGSHFGPRVSVVDDGRENLSACVPEAPGQRRPSLVDIRGARPPEADARHHYTGQTLVAPFSALTMIIEANPLGRLMGNVYWRIAKPGIPTQSFEESDAVAWLLGHPL